MQRNEAALLDIERACRQILSFSTGLTRDMLAANVEKQSAILYQVVVVGEATKRLSQVFRDQHPEVPWRDMAGMRDIVAHQYDRVDVDDLWQVVRDDIPELLSLLQPLLPKP